MSCKYTAIQVITYAEEPLVLPGVVSCLVDLILAQLAIYNASRLPSATSE